MTKATYIPGLGGSGELSCIRVLFHLYKDLLLNTKRELIFIIILTEIHLLIDFIFFRAPCQ